MGEPLISQDEIHREVQKAIADALQISVEKVEPDSSLIRDLAAESLDFIDINFRLEQRFGVAMPRKYLLEHVEELFGEGTAIDEGGRLTAQAVTIWNARLGSVGTRDSRGHGADEVPALVTPRTLVMVVEEILTTCPDTCPSCGKAGWKLADGSAIGCGACGAHAPLLTGDEVIRRWLENFRAPGGPRAGPLDRRAAPGARSSAGRRHRRGNDHAARPERRARPSSAPARAVRESTTSAASTRAASPSGLAARSWTSGSSDHREPRRRSSRRWPPARSGSCGPPPRRRSSRRGSTGSRTGTGSASSSAITARPRPSRTSRGSTGPGTAMGSGTRCGSGKADTTPSPSCGTRSTSGRRWSHACSIAAVPASASPRRAPPAARRSVRPTGSSGRAVPTRRSPAAARRPSRTSDSPDSFSSRP